MDETPGYLRLDPKPIARPDLAAEWLERMARGACLVLVSLPVLAAMGAVFRLAIGPPWTTELVLYPVSTFIGVAAVWLLTAPEPGRAEWLRPIRWTARIGVLCQLAGHVLRVAARTDVLPPSLSLWHVVAAEQLCKEAGAAGVLGCVWYACRLCRRIGDETLASIFAGCRTAAVFLVIFMVVVGITSFRTLVGNNVEMIERGEYSSVQNWPWAGRAGMAVLYMSMALVAAWAAWRIRRRLRLAAREMRP